MQYQTDNLKKVNSLKLPQTGNIMAKSNTSEQINHFKEYHEYLKEHDKIEFISTIETICQVLGISTPTYYRVLKNPQQLSIADKKAIAGVYKLPEHFLFPELKQTA